MSTYILTPTPTHTNLRGTYFPIGERRDNSTFRGLSKVVEEQFTSNLPTHTNHPIHPTTHMQTYTAEPK